MLRLQRSLLAANLIEPESKSGRFPHFDIVAPFIAEFLGSPFPPDGFFQNAGYERFPKESHNPDIAKTIVRIEIKVNRNMP
jgi:hypothetical protein